MHKLDEVKELIQLKFEGIDEILCTMLKNIPANVCRRRLMNIPVRYQRFDGEDQEIAVVVQDLCERRAWEGAVRFASEVEFVGQETPLEMIADGCQHEGRWDAGASLWAKAFECKLKQGASWADLLHNLANAYLHLRRLRDARTRCMNSTEKK